MRIHLAPMEGVVNARMRALITAVGGVDRCVTEFVRVSDQLLPARVFHRLCPELKDQGLTPSGIPVYVQLLGSDPALMGENAHRAATLGAPGIDINFGCPAKCVNRHRGGAVLLDEPALLHQIVNQVRRAVDPAIPVTAKIRLGYRDTGRLGEIVDAIVSAGANELTIHARTKEDGYKPPAHWQHIAPLKQRHSLPIYANGEIWQVSDYQACVIQSQCEDVMLGRGLLAQPDLALQIKTAIAGTHYLPMAWQAVLQLLIFLFEDSLITCQPRHVGGPVKQWLGYLRRTYPEAGQLFSTIKRLTSPEDLHSALQQHRRDVAIAA